MKSLLCAATIIPLLCGAVTATEPAKPNIIVFLVDDMGLMDTSLPFVVDAERKEEFLNHFPHQHRSSYFTSYVKGDWKVIYHYPAPKAKAAKYELYNLKNDPYEKKNLAGSNPEHLKTMMTAMVKDLKDKKALMPELGKEKLSPEIP